LEVRNIITKTDDVTVRVRIQKKKLKKIGNVAEGVGNYVGTGQLLSV
jgi:hypothetical protein